MSETTWSIKDGYSGIVYADEKPVFVALATDEMSAASRANELIEVFRLSSRIKETLESAGLS